MKFTTIINKILSPLRFVWSSEPFKAVVNKPVPGIDANFHLYCRTCDSSEMHSSRGGYRIGGVLHCYTCGTETEINTIPVNSTAEEMITSSWAHWLKFPRIPYNWHELSEPERWSILENGK